MKINNCIQIPGFIVWNCINFLFFFALKSPSSFNSTLSPLRLLAMIQPQNSQRINLQILMRLILENPRHTNIIVHEDSSLTIECKINNIKVTENIPRC
jgi:hypothetical protein